MITAATILIGIGIYAGCAMVLGSLVYTTIDSFKRHERRFTVMFAALALLYSAILAGFSLLALEAAIGG